MTKISFLQKFNPKCFSPESCFFSKSFFINLSGSFDWDCTGCSILYDGDSIIVENQHGEPTYFELSTAVYLEESQNVRVTVHLIDYVAELIGDNSLARSSFKAYIDYGDGVQSQKTHLECNKECFNGVFIGDIDVKTEISNSGTYTLKIEIYAYKEDKFRVNLLSFGDFILASKVFDESKERL